MNINELAKECHEIALSKGWYDNRERPVTELIMLIVTELAEAVEAHRNGRFTDFSDYSISELKLEHFTEISYKEPEQIKAFNDCIKDTFEDEIADTFIRLLDMCAYLKIDIEKHIRAKMEYNKTREYKHGKRY